MLGYSKEVERQGLSSFGTMLNADGEEGDSGFLPKEFSI